MKRIIYLLFIFIPLSAWSLDATKEIKKDFLSEEFNKLRISNDFGNLTFLPTTSDSISVKVHIVADVMEIADTSDIFRYIKTDMYPSKKTLRIATTFDADLDKATHVNVHYTILVPDSIHLEMSNRYGNISLFNVYGTKKIQLEYGKLLFDTITCPSFPPSSISLSYADLSGSKVDSANITIENGSISVDEMHHCSINSSYSIIHIKNGIALKSTSLSDKYAISSVQDFTITGEKSIANIKFLEKSLKLDFTAGSVNIASVSPDFEGIDINLHNSKANISPAISTNYIINAVTQFGTFNYPTNYTISKVVDLDQTTYTGTSGGEKNAEAQIGIVGYNSEITIK